MRRCVLCLLCLFCLPGLRSTASAQIKSQVEVEIDEARREAEARRESKAIDARNNAANASEAQRRADMLELLKLRSVDPGSTARNTAEADARNAAIRAREKIGEANLAQSMLNAHVRARKEELDAFLANPPAPPVPGSYTECDELASAPFDGTRPLGINGVGEAAMQKGAAIASCREELAKHPESARTAFELGRALLAAGRCDEGVPVIKDALAKGSAAAAVSYALLIQGPCKSAAVSGNMEKYLKIAADMGSGDGAWILGQLYSEAGKRVEKDSDASKELWDAEKAAYWRAYNLGHDRAKKGDLDALFIEAYLAHYTGSMILGYDSINAQYRCAVRGYAPCLAFDAVGGR